MEIWKPVVGFEQLYLVSNAGHVKTLGRDWIDTRGRKRENKSKLMTQTPTGRKSSDTSYLGVTLTKDNIRRFCHVHRLVADAFIENENSLPCVNHKDGNKQNNNVDNLEWCTYSHNNQHAYDNNLKHDNKKIIQVCIYSNVIIGFYNTLHEASVITGFSRNHISNACKSQKLYKDCRWYYAKDFIGMYEITKMPVKNILLKRLMPDAVIPAKVNQHEAGFDLYAYSPNSTVTIPDHETAFISTGIAIEIPSGYWGGVYARSGLACNQGLRPANCVGVIDSSYRGEIKVALHNDFNQQINPILIKHGDRIAQLVIHKCEDFEFVEVDELSETERGVGGFGSSGR